MTALLYQQGWAALGTAALIGWLVQAAVMTALWAVQRRTGNATIVDIAWTGGVWWMALLATVYPWDQPSAVRFVVLASVTVWAARLLAHVIPRIRNEGEDPRYAELRHKWGDKAQLRLFLYVFQAQGLLVPLLGVPFLLAAHAPPATWWLPGTGALLFVVALLGESVADRQLAAFKADPANKGRVCKRGLWRWSRHPNYFFEFCVWLGWGLMAAATPWGWLGFLAPGLILFFLLCVTGIPPAEAQALRSRGDAYRQYQRETSAFIPLPSRQPEEES